VINLGVVARLAVGEKVRSGVPAMGVACVLAAAQNWKKVPDGATPLGVETSLAVGEKVRSGVIRMGVVASMAAAQN
jgi:hypothetical protein